MSRRLLLPLVLLIGLSASVVQAVPITVENFSFELPGTTKQTSFANVPGWSVDSTPGDSDSGVETGWTPTDGTWTGYLRGGTSDPAIWQLTDHVIAYGDVFELKVDSRITSGATTLQMTLYYDKDGTRAIAATSTVPLTSTMATYSLTFASTSVPASVGHKIGIEFANPSGSGTWLGLDMVRLDLLVKGVTGGALAPSPADLETDVLRDANFSWKPGQWANTHNIYLGTSFDDVNTATVAAPLGVLAKQAHDANTFEPGRLEFGQTYYWRVDEVNAPPSTKIYKGLVWTFTVEPYSYPIDGSKITASASSESTEEMSAQKTIDGSGLDSNGLHDDVAENMWLSGDDEVFPAWIQYVFDQPYLLDKMMVWNSNQSLESIIGFGAKDVTVDYSQDGETWTNLGQFEFTMAQGLLGYAADTTVGFGSIPVKAVKLTITSNWGGLLEQAGLSEVKFYAVPVFARNPNPALDAANVAPQTTLSWRAGRQATSHKLYLSTDQQAVAGGTVTAVTTTQPSYPTTLDLAQTYYWNVVEVNTAETPSTWTGDVWSFSTAAYIVIDDFESYTNDSPNRVFQTWIDGGGFSADDYFSSGNSGNGTGSFVGYDPLQRDIMETTAVHGGRQSAPFFYSNDASTPTSETTRTFSQAQDWTASAIKTLSLCFYGDPNNTGSAPLWVMLREGTKSSVKVNFGAAAGEDVVALTEPAWTEWNIPLASFTGINLAKVTAITIGMGPGNGSGQIFIDDIRLYPARDLPTPPAAILAGWWKFDNNATDSSGNGNNGTLGGGATYNATGKIGAALSLDGIDDFVDCGNKASLNITDTVTVAAWIKTSDTGNAQSNEYVSKGDESYCIKHNTGNFIEFFIYDGANWNAAQTAVLTTAFNNVWHHLAGTFDGTQVKLYLDGKLVGSRLYSGPIAVATQNLNIGRNSRYTDRLYYGLIDDVRIYHGVLPSAEISKLANP
jgi:hypothetical protein